MKNILLFFFFILIFKTGISQENYASNILTSVSDGEKLLVSYDINASDGTKSFSVILMLTYNGTKITASSVYGDIGSSIEPGSEKAIVWYFKSEFDGNINDVVVEVFAYKENEPQAVFDIVSTSNNGYAPCEIKFSNNSSYANEYQWDFGDSSSGARNVSFQKEPSHTYENGGIFNVALIARNTQLQLENTFYQSIEIKEHENTIANFEIDGNNQLAPARVKFKNTSENADSYHWNFGDPASKKKNESKDKDTEHKYARAGTYSVELTVSNSFSKLSHKIIKEVVVEQEKLPEAKFTYSKSAETAPATVVFKNTSSSSARYKWEFGDPESGGKNESSESNPVHIFEKAGTFKVVLSAFAKGVKKPAKYTEEITIKALPKPPVARFTMKNNNVYGPATIVFENSSENASIFNWDFGDPASGSNNSSDKKNPTHTYTATGRYKVVLTAKNPNFNEAGTFSDFVIIIEKAKPVILPGASFRIENNNAPSPAIVSFTNTSVKGEVYNWDFGDPGSEENASILKNPTHVYSSPGRYLVSLTVKNESSDQSDSFTDYVVVTEPAKPIVRPVAQFTIESNNNVAPASVAFSNTSSNADTYEWNFGDTSAENNTSTERNPSHTYTKAGTFKVELKVINKSSGLTSTFSEFIMVSPPLLQPKANFEIVNDKSVEPATITFTNTSLNANSYAWNFGDPLSGSKNTSTLESPKHLYNKAGDYKVVLAVLNKESGKEDVFEKMVRVEKRAEPPVANFEILKNSDFVPANVQFRNLSSNADVFEWDFGDFQSEVNTSKENAPSHNYSQPGNYKITLKVSNAQTNQTSEISKEISLKSNFITFVKRGRELSDNKSVISFVQTSSDDYLFVLKNSLLKLSKVGEVLKEEKLNNPIYHIIPADERDQFLMLGLSMPGNLLFQQTNKNLKIGNPVVLQENKNFKTDFGGPKFSVSRTSEVGIVANAIDDKYPLNILFEKMDKSGRRIPLLDRTFKYIGTKLATDIIPVEDGGFAITGYWKENPGDPTLILFGKIDTKGKGVIHLINSKVSVVGLDIEQAFNGGYAVLRARENEENKELYDLSFFIIDDDGDPTDCSNDLPCSIKTEDVLNYEPAMIKTNDGFIIASHAFNGFDYNIRIFWIDKLGNVLKNYQDIILSNDQFVMDMKQTKDGGLMIIGTERNNGTHSAFVIKTDANGKINP